MIRRAAIVLLVSWVVVGSSAGRARDRAPGFFQQRLDLPGIPAAVVPADLTGDGRDDLVVLVAYSGWTTRSEFEPAKFDDIEGLVEVMNVIDELVDRRELRLYPARVEGDGFAEPLAALDLDATVHARGVPAAAIRRCPTARSVSPASCGTWAWPGSGTWTATAGRTSTWCTR